MATTIGFSGGCSHFLKLDVDVDGDRDVSGNGTIDNEVSASHSPQAQK